MSTKQDGETKTILRKLALLIFLFYLLQYGICLICAAAMDTWEYEGEEGKAKDRFSPALLPFWHYDCGLGQGDIALISWLSIAVSQLLLIFLIYFIVRSTKHAWDYSVTLSFFHFIATCAATRDAPTNWVWYVTICVATLVVSVASELMCYFLHDLREIAKD
mmetsp:Transcript_17150/g.26541  ORF Transcript_17150/g.26541 Transcript_17150/m.26541 type:complete len:162 (+) Transcript_17150:58-543(+)